MSFGGHKFLRIVQVLIFVALLYGIDHTPLSAERIVAYFHLGTFGAFVVALVGILVLWQVSKMVLGLLLLVFGALTISGGRQGESFDTFHFVPGGIEYKADKPILTEQEAAAVLVGSSFRNTQHEWPTVYNALKEFREEKFVVGDESRAAFDLGLAAIALDMQAVKNLFPVEQADRIENWVLTWVWNFADTNGRGGYAVDEVTKYGVAFQRESRIGAEFALGAIPGRLLQRWLGETIKNFESEIGGKKSGFIDTMLMSEATSVSIGFSGLWKALADKYELVDGAPQYALTTTKILENLEKTDQIMTDQNLTEAQRAAAIKALSRD